MLVILPVIALPDLIYRLVASDPPALAPVRSKNCRPHPQRLGSTGTRLSTSFVFAGEHEQTSSESSRESTGYFNTQGASLLVK